MNKKGHILVNLGQFKDETPCTVNTFKIFGVRKSKKKTKKKSIRLFLVATARKKVSNISQEGVKFFWLDL